MRYISNEAMKEKCLRYPAVDLLIVFRFSFHLIMRMKFWADRR
jgi:hypothetical protein